MSEVMDYAIQPHLFRSFASGGAQYNHHSEAMVVHGSYARRIWFKQGYF